MYNDYMIVRSARKTLVISITDGNVIVKAPLKMPEKHIKEFVESKADWIQKKLAAFDGKTEALKNIIDYTHVLWYGKEYEIAVTDKVKRVTLGDKLLIPVKYAQKDAAINAIKNWYKREAEKELSKRLSELSSYTGLKYASFALTNAKGKWGSCDTKCNIRLNWRLVMVEKALVDYVIVHELSHTVHHDHSREFWAEVGKYYQKYKLAKKRLKSFSVLTSLYR